ncbi:MAG: TetR/AcrR family transcriptional regulator [Archangium sp.]|nr:TetR/AcrR family transcriptional regulator [Archangium sp.]
MRTADPELHERRRTQILLAARRAFLERGFHQTSMADLAKASGVSMGLLYRYFANKEDLIAQFAERDRDVSLRRIEALAAADDWVAALEALLGPVVDEAFEADAAPLTFEVLAEACRTPRVLKRLRRDDQLVRQALVDAVELHQRRGTMSKAYDARAAAEVLLSLFDGLLGRALMHPGLSRRALRQALRGFVVAALSPPRQPMKLASP